MKSSATAIALVALAASVPTALAGKHKLKLQKMPLSSSFNSNALLNNIQSQAAWLNQKYFGSPDSQDGSNGYVQKKFRYGRPLAGQKSKNTKGEVNIQMIEEEEFEAVNHDVPLSSES